MYLENLTPIETFISHGNLGLKGSMGYEIIPSVNGQNYNHIISAHASSILKYDLNQKYNSFHCYIALNDSSSDQASVEFQVICDGKLSFVSSKVKKFDKLRPVNIDISGVSTLELRCFNHGDNVSHSLWIDALCSEGKIDHHVGPFNNTHINLDFERRKSKYACIVFASGNMAKFLYAFLKTFQKNSNLNDCVNYIVISEESFVIRKIAKIFNAIVIRSYKTLNYPVTSPVDFKDSTYSICSFIDADYFVISDIDILVEKDLSNSFEDGKIGICRDANTEDYTFGQLIESDWSAYSGNKEWLEFLKLTQHEKECKDIINSGILLGSKKDFLILNDELRKLLPESQFYLCFNNGTYAREQALINLALIRTSNYKILDKSYNYQLLWENFPEKVQDICLHLTGQESKNKYKYLIDQQCDDIFHKINKNLFEDFLELNSFKNILCIGNLNFDNKVSNDDWVKLKKISNQDNSFDCVVYDHFDDLANTKVRLFLINKILKEGKVVILTSKENLRIFNSLQIEYDLLGTDFGREILVIEK